MPRDWRRSLLVGLGVVLVAGLALLNSDRVEERAESALGRGMPAREAELARGFVLGRDEEIDPRTVEDFRRAGLSHLLAVSGQNVTLLALLAMPVLAALGIPLRDRLLWVLGLIAVYVPLAGAGPSIQRAGVMGALGVLATLLGRRASRFHALALAAIVTLAVNPHALGDVGWQLSFAAVVGIFLLASPLRDAIAARLGSGGWRRALAEGIAVTIAATLATAPLIAYRFEAVSTLTLLSNLLALPAVAPAMWLGMVAAAAGQVPGLPVGAVNALEAPLLAYVAQVAAWCGRPGWAYVHVHLSAAGLAASYLAMAAALLAWARLRRALAIAVSLAGLVAWVAISEVAVGPGAGAPPSSGLRVEVLDVGQGDSILLQPAGAAPVLVDGGPPGDRVGEKLRAAGVSSLATAVVTHDEADHAGGIAELLGRLPVRRLAYAFLGRDLRAEARSAGATPLRVAEGDEIRSGALRLDVLWPPRSLLAEGLPPGADRNLFAVVILARWHSFSMLLTADAEAESVPLDPGPIDVLKVAHHGSDDAGLAGLLERTKPKLAVISVGAGNSYGHPTPETLATLARHEIRTLRTDQRGTLVLDVDSGFTRVVAGN